MENCKEVRCELCGLKLCYEHNNSKEIIGHFNFNEKTYCIWCFKKHESDILEGKL